MPDWELAVSTEITAVQLRDELIIRAIGEKPTPCYEVRVQETPLTIEPPEFVLQWRQKPGTRLCPSLVTPYDIRGAFPMPYRDHVIVRDRGGAKSVPVKIVKTAIDEYLRGGGGFPGPFERETESKGGPGGVPGPFGLDASKSGIRTAVGYSNKLSFDEAFEDALRHLPAVEPQHPDQMEIVRITDIGAEFGGIIPLNRLFMRIAAISR